MALLEKKSKHQFLSTNIIKMSDNFFIAQKKNSNQIVAVPIYIHTFRFITPKKVMEAKRFALDFPDPTMLSAVADKLRYYRHQKGLYQIEVADYLGIDRGTYSSYEKRQTDFFSPTMMDKIAELFEVSVYDLLDDYNKFIYNGQGAFIKSERKRIGITQKELAKLMSVDLTKVKRWEQDKVRMFKFTWEKLISLTSTL